MYSKISSIYQYFVTLFPTTASHNIAKLNALRVIFHNLALDKVEGPYVEFGVAFGNSLNAALLANKKTAFKALGIPTIERKFFGFDTFKEFSSTSPEDEHKTWSGSLFSTNVKNVEKRFSKRKNVILLQTDVCSLATTTVDSLKLNNVILDQKVAVVMFDMDLKAPTLSALIWIEPKLMPGSILIFDEFFGFAGDSTLGEAGAFAEFSEKYSDIVFREVMRYGTGGVVFQVSQRVKKAIR
jgi:hypothetical protein